MSTKPAAHGSRHAQLPEPLRSAVIAHEDGKLDVAYPLYRKFVADNPQQPTALQLFGLLLSQLGQYEVAIALMRESLHLFPEQPEVANNLGNALSKIGLFDEAIESYSEAVRQLPDYLEARRNLGLCYAKTNQLQKALACYERCLELRPDDPATWVTLGNLHRDADNIDGAIVAFEKALQLKPDYASAHHNLGVCLRLQHRPEEALEHYTAARAAGLDRAELYHNIGNALIDSQQAGPAIDAYREALARDSDNLDTHRNLNSLLWQQHMLDDYLRSYRDVLDERPDAERVRLAYATALNLMEEWEEAEKILREGLTRAGGSADAKSLLANTLEGQGRWEEALRMHEAAVNTSGSVPNHLISYGRALLACKRPDEALSQVQAGTAMMPFDQRALAYLGLCWRLLGDERDDVLNDYDKLVIAYDLPVPDGYGSAAEFNERLRDVLLPLHFGIRHPSEQTQRNGSQTSGNLFDRREPEIRALMASLELCIEDYIGRFPQSKEHPLYMRRSDGFKFSESWSVRLAPCGYHAMHTHPLGWVSSAYYVEVPHAVEEGDEHGGGIKFGEPDIDIGEAGDARLSMQPSVGRLLLFPSYMWHGTVPFDCDEPRMTTPFDVVPT